MTGVIGIPLFLPCVIFSHTWALVGMVLLFSLVGVYEALKCVGLNKKPFFAVTALAVTAVAQILPRINGFSGEKYTSTILLIYIVYTVFLMVGAVFSKGAVKIVDAMVCAVMTVYISFGFSSLVLLRDRDFGIVLLFLALLIPLISDAMAYFIGVFFGKHKLIPDVSPKKTIEGAIGGIVGVCVIVCIFGLIMQFGFGKVPNYPILLLLVFVGSIVGMCGDLIASLLKREYKIKDFGKFFPGHGGVMDRFDSIVAVSTFMYVICLMFSASYLFITW